LPKAAGINATAIVTDGYQEAFPAECRRDRHATLACLPRTGANVGGFDAVIHRIAHEMDQCFAHRFKNPTVGFNVSTGDDQRGGLPDRGGCITDGTGQCGARIREGAHPDATYALEEITDHIAKCVGVAADVAAQIGGVVQDAV
jgi:hypothetical protein